MDFRKVIKKEVLSINNMKINVLESINDYFNSFSKHDYDSRLMKLNSEKKSNLIKFILDNLDNILNMLVRYFNIDCINDIKEIIKLNGLKMGIFKYEKDN